jgi:hypothetical protein
VTALEEFLDSQRARRAAAGKPDHTDDDSLYRLLDGLLADRAEQGYGEGFTPAGAAAIARGGAT